MLVVLESCAHGQKLAKNSKFRAQLTDEYKKINIVYHAEIRAKSQVSAKVFIGSTKDFISKYIAQIMQQSHFLLLHIYAN